MRCSVCNEPKSEKNRFIGDVCDKCYNDVKRGKLNSRNMKLFIKLKTRGKIF